MTIRRAACAACLAAFALAAAPAAAATINVPDDQPTIAAAIAASVAGDEIVVAPGTYTENININKAVTVRSVNPSSATAVAATIIDGGGVARTVSISQGGALAGFVVTNGAEPASGGGGVDCGSGPSTISDCVITGNSAVFGGGMRSRGAAETTFLRCTFSDNTAQQGAAFDDNADSTTFVECTFIANTSTGPGFERAALISRGSTVVRNCTFIANTGGGYETTGNGSPAPTLDGCNFICNTPFGIAHRNAGTDLTVRDTAVCNNTPDDLVGNPILDDGGNSLSGCTINETSSDDDCPNAVEIGLGDTGYSTVGATDDGLLLPPSCEEGFGLNLGADIWFRYVPCADGTLTVSTCGQIDYDSRLAAYTGSCGALTLVACNDDGPGCGLTSLMEVSVSAGEPVLLRVGGFSDGAGSVSSGSGTLTLSLEESCATDVDGDSVVGFSDLLEVLTSWGPCP